MKSQEIENRIYYAIRFIVRPLGIPDGVAVQAAHVAMSIIRDYIDETNSTCTCPPGKVSVNDSCPVHSGKVVAG